MKKPFLHAFAAIMYIVVVASIISATSGTDKKTMLLPVIVLSLLVLSVAVMGFLFFYEPVSLFMENRKKEGTAFFLKTIGFFASFLIIASLLYLLV